MYRDHAISRTLFHWESQSTTTERSIPDPVSGHGDVTVRFAASAAPYVKERYGDRVRPDLDRPARVVEDHRRGALA